MKKVEYVKVSKLKLHPRNPRLIKDAQFKTLCNSIKDNKDFFEARPIIVSTRTGENIIIAGNQRYRAAREIGLKKVPVVIFNNLTEKKEKEIMIRDNAISGQWNYDILANEFDIDDLESWGIEDMKNLFFETGEVEESGASNNKIFIKIEIPPKLWLLSKDELIKQFSDLSEQYGFEVEFPK